MRGHAGKVEAGKRKDRVDRKGYKGASHTWNRTYLYVCLAGPCAWPLKSILSSCIYLLNLFLTLFLCNLTLYTVCALQGLSTSLLVSPVCVWVKCSVSCWSQTKGAGDPDLWCQLLEPVGSVSSPNLVCMPVYSLVNFKLCLPVSQRSEPPRGDREQGAKVSS